ncbi:helix-turn-helix transcriptional regulator [Flavobacteriales bacterium]|nr:helix-turn-helix transcriptional regulator [Flavobacteriales bacterium]
MINVFKFSCPITSALDIIGDRWILIILKQMLFEDKQTFKDFKESSENIASNILTVRLNLLLKNGLISKSKIKTNNKSIFYHLTDSGLSVSSILIELGIWGKENLANFNQLMNKKEDASKIKPNYTHVKNLKKRYKAKLAKTEFIKI